jgi:hypothetical protein
MTREQAKECGCLCYNIHGVTRHYAVIFTDIVFKNRSHFTRKLVANTTVEGEEGCELYGTLLFMEIIIASGPCRLR